MKPKKTPLLLVYFLSMVLVLAVASPVFAFKSNAFAPFNQMVASPGFGVCSTNSGFDSYSTVCSNGQFSGSAEQSALAWSGFVFGANGASSVYFNTAGSSSPRTPIGWGGGTLYLWEGFSLYGHFTTSSGGVAGVGTGFDVTTTYCYTNQNGQIICNTTTTEKHYFVFQNGGGSSGDWICTSCGVEYNYGSEPAQPFNAGGGLFTQATVGGVGSASADFWTTGHGYSMSTSYVTLSDCQFC